MTTYAALHAPIMPVLRQVFQHTPLQPGEVALDVACGTGEKLPLLREAIGPHATLLALDSNRNALGALAADTGAQAVQAAAEAIALCDACCTLVTCIAALGVFANPHAACSEMRRVLKPAGRALIVTAAYQWVELTDWSPEAVAIITAANAAARFAHPDVAGAPVTALLSAGFRSCQPRAFLIEPAHYHAEFALLSWQHLEPLVGSTLTPAQRAVCAAAPSELELRSIVLAVWATT